MQSRAALEAAMRAAADRFGVPYPTPANLHSEPAARIPRPPFWGEYYVWLDSVELWVEGAARIHERASWSRELTSAGDGFEGGPWTGTRLQP